MWVLRCCFVTPWHRCPQVLASGIPFPLSACKHPFLGRVHAAGGVAQPLTPPPLSGDHSRTLTPASPCLPGTPGWRSGCVCGGWACCLGGHPGGGPGGLLAGERGASGSSQHPKPAAAGWGHRALRGLPSRLRGPTALGPAPRRVPPRTADCGRLHDPPTGRLQPARADFSLWPPLFSPFSKHFFGKRVSLVENSSKVDFLMHRNQHPVALLSPFFCCR